MRRKGIGRKAGRVWEERGGGRRKDLAEGPGREVTKHGAGDKFFQ